MEKVDFNGLNPDQIKELQKILKHLRDCVEGLSEGVSAQQVICIQQASVKNIAFYKENVPGTENLNELAEKVVSQVSANPRDKELRKKVLDIIHTLLEKTEHV